MAQLEFYNTRSRRRERFEPIDCRRVRMYVCGPTVYERAHIGNARPAVVFDVLYRLLRQQFGGEHVVYVRNITDVDDKINGRAVQLRNSGDSRSLIDIVRSVTDRTVAWYHEDMQALSVLSPDFEPRATEFIPEMVALIDRLIGGGFAYPAAGHVLFSVDAYEDYGKLAHRSLDDMVAGARVEIAPYKKNSMDFVLWKPSSEDEPGWESPWGRGRPGWHIECSAMSLQLLGPDFDIHAGGVDLVFPHHENEVAQSLCANPDSGFARYWMHNGFLQIEGEKMAKSLGNFLTVKDLRDRGIDGDAIRLALLSTHYRRPLDWTEKKLAENCQTVARWRDLTAGQSGPAGPPAPAVVAALAGDLNTPGAIAVLHQLAKDGDARQLKASAGLLGLLEHREHADHPGISDEEAALIARMVEDRARARQQQDFAVADRIRHELEASGVEIKDGRTGTEWRLTGRFDRGRLQTLRRPPHQTGDDNQ